VWTELPKVHRGRCNLAGDVEGGGKVLAQAAESDGERRRASWALALLSRDSPSTLEALLSCMKDKRPELRRMAVTEHNGWGPRGLSLC